MTDSTKTSTATDLQHMEAFVFKEHSQEPAEADVIRTDPHIPSGQNATPNHPDRGLEDALAQYQSDFGIDPDTYFLF